MACETTTDTPNNVNTVKVRTKEDNIRPTEKQHTTNRAMKRVRAHVVGEHYHIACAVSL